MQIKDAREIKFDSFFPITIRLPFPPSGNRQARHAAGAHYLSPEATRYRGAVRGILWELGYGHYRKPMPGPLAIEVLLVPATKHAMDADNRLKSLLDALVKGGLLEDDSNRVVRSVYAEWGEPQKDNPHAIVSVTLFERKFLPVSMTL